MNELLYAISNVLLSTGAVQPTDQVTPENLDLALKTYIRNVIEEYNEQNNL